MGETFTINVPQGSRYGQAFVRDPSGLVAKDKFVGNGPQGVYDQSTAAEAETDRQRGQSDSNGAFAGLAAQTGYGLSRASEDKGLAGSEAASRYGDQNSAIGLAGTMARGSRPSAAAYQLQSGLNQGMAQQQSAAAGARGSAALATAGQRAADVSAGLQQNAYTQGRILKANEMSAGRSLYGNLTTQQANQDMERIGQGNAMNQFNAKQADAYQSGMAGLDVGFGQLNNAQNQTNQGAEQNGMHAMDQQAAIDRQRATWLAQARSQANANNADQV